jgi:hypothetical protein
MVSRCKICGTVTNGVTICNSCGIASEERRFFRMVNREELKSTRRIIDQQEKRPQTNAIADR